jgi:glycosyltransferase involved in cell wall biosynthesis
MPSDSNTGKQEAGNSNYMSESNRVAVVVPVRNRPDLLDKCLSSLVNQDFPLNDCEVLICDDGSTDDIQSVVQGFRGILNVQLLRQKAKGPAAARNLGICKSIAPIIIFLDSDVLPDQTLVSHLINALDKNSEWMGAEARIESMGGEKSPLWDGPICHNGGYYHTAAIAYRREAIIKAEGFDENFKLPACEDVELGVRVIAQGTIGYVSEAVAYHPVRRVTLRTHWYWSRHWKYEMILAKRYGFLSFPGHPAGPFPRLRVALAAVVTLPAGRFIEGVKYVRHKPSDGMLGCLYALFDVFCGFWAFPSILFSPIPPRKNYLSDRNQDTIQ